MFKFAACCIIILGTIVGISVGLEKGFQEGISWGLFTLFFCGGIECTAYYYIEKYKH